MCHANDVSAYEFALRTPAQMKKSKSCDLDFLAGVAGFMTETSRFALVGVSAREVQCDIGKEECCTPPRHSSHNHLKRTNERFNFVCAKRNIIGRKPTPLRSTSFARSATSFICAACRGNDVEPRLK